MIDLWWHSRLHQSGFRLTTSRAIIIQILREDNNHLSAEDIYVKALKINSSIGLTTVYRTLDLFNQVGLVQKFDFGDGKSRYELIHNPDKKKHHHHLICTKCKTIIDYTDFLKEKLELMEKIEKILSKNHDFKIMKYTIHFYGLCSHCQQDR